MPTPTPRGRILIIEDSPATQRLLTLFLEQDGYVVTSCFDGESGLEAALREEFDLLLLDIALPGMNGWEVLRAIRDTDHGAAMPVIVLTAHHDTVLSNGSEPLAATVERVVGKPFDVTDLSSFVDEILTGAA